MHLLEYVDEVLEQRDVRHAPGAGTSAGSTSNGKLLVDLVFLDDLIALRAMDVFSEYYLLFSARHKNPQEARGAFSSSWIGIFWQPRSIQMDEEGEWGNEVSADLRPEGRIDPRFQEVGARPCISERRNGLERGIYN